MVYVGSSGGGKKPSKKKAKKRGGFGGFLENFVDDVQDTATGLIPGLAHVGSSLAHDAGKAIGIRGGQYRTDDILRTIGRSYTDRGTFWGELGRISLLNPTQIDDRLRGAGKAFYDNPLGPLLDVAAIFTGGAGAAVKGGKLLGKVPETRYSAVEFAPSKGFIRPLSENPVIAGRQRLVDAASNRFVDAPLMGARARTSRFVRKQDQNRTMRENAQNLKPLRDALSKVHGLRRKAVWIVAGGHSLDDLDNFYAKREADLLAEANRKKEAGIRRGETTLAVKGDRVKRADVDEDLAYEEAPLESLVEADRRDSLKINQRNLARVKARREELALIRKKGILDKPDPQLQAAADAANRLSELTTSRLVTEGLKADRAANRATLESQILRMAGVRDDVYKGAIRSHVSLSPQKMDVSSGRGRSKWTAGPKPDAMQRNSGYNFWNAADNTNPAMYIHSAREVFEYRARINRFEAMLEYGQMVSAKRAAELEREGWKVLSPKSKVMDDAEASYKVLAAAGDVLEGTPGYRQIMDALEESFVAPRKLDGASDDLVAVVPGKFYTEVVGEFAKSSAFIRKWIDSPTRVWRALTLNMRPAWLVNNFVGQMLLLAVAHGAQGLRAYVEQFVPGRKGMARAADELAPELTDFGWAHESMADLAGLGGNKITSGMRRMSDFMGRLNAKLTDDHTRKAAWVATMKPHVARYRKAHPELDWHEAARELWKNERFADEVTQRVLDDMIDFSDLSNFERRVVKRAIPFWAWISGISKRTGRLVMDDPVKAAVGVQAGQLGIAANEEQYGTLPHFLKGIIGSPFGDENTILTTQGLNPFMTPADITAMISGTVLPGRQDGPQNPLAQANPLLKAPLEALANRDFFFGGEVDREGDMSFLQRAGKQGLNSFAQKRLIDEWFQQRKAETEGLEYDPLYEPSFRNAVLQYLGLPQRQLDVKAARKRASEDT